MNWRNTVNFELTLQPNHFVKFRFDFNIHFKTYAQVLLSYTFFVASCEATFSPGVFQKLSAILGNDAPEFRSAQLAPETIFGRLDLTVQQQALCPKTRIANTANTLPSRCQKNKSDSLKK